MTVITHYITLRRESFLSNIIHLHTTITSNDEPYSQVRLTIVYNKVVLL
jgi:hypothetical protein